MAMYQDLHGTLEGKVQTSHRLIDKLEARSKSLQQNIEATKASLGQLEIAYREKEEPLKLCAWRMEQRQKRPLKEHIRDQVEIALEEERVSLAETQRKLQDAMVVTKNIISILVEKGEELKIDIDQKLQALSVDELCLRTAARSWTHSASSRVPTSRGSTAIAAQRRTASSGGSDVLASGRNEINRQNDARVNDVAARRREEAAVELRKDNEILVQRCEKTAKDCLRKTEKGLQERVTEVKQMRKRLENELRETQRMVNHTMSTISETQSQIHAIQEPIALCSTHASWRKQRADAEMPLDPVDNQLESQKQKLMQATEELRSHRQNKKNILTQLGEQGERLTEDLKDKTLALNIDITCLEKKGTMGSRGGTGRSQATPRSARGTSGSGRPWLSSGRSKFGMVDSRLLPTLGSIPTN
jgi:hypothetical protein